MDAFRSSVRRSEEKGAILKIHRSARELTEEDLFNWVPGDKSTAGKVMLPESLYLGAKKVVQEKEETEKIKRNKAAVEALTKKIFENQSRVRQNLQSLEKIQSSA